MSDPVMTDLSRHVKAQGDAELAQLALEQEAALQLADPQRRLQLGESFLECLATGTGDKEQAAWRECHRWLGDRCGMWLSTHAHWAFSTSSTFTGAAIARGLIEAVYESQETAVQDQLHELVASLLQLIAEGDAIIRRQYPVLFAQAQAWLALIAEAQMMKQAA